MIRLADNLSIRNQLFTLAHEAAHVLLNHVSQTNITHADAVRSAGEILDHSPEVAEREDPADALAVKLLAKWYSLIRIT